MKLTYASTVIRFAATVQSPRLLRVMDYLLSSASETDALGVAHRYNYDWGFSTDWLMGRPGCVTVLQLMDCDTEETVYVCIRPKALVDGDLLRAARNDGYYSHVEVWEMMARHAADRVDVLTTPTNR